MKKLLALLLALVMVFSLATLFAGCDDDSKKSSSSSKDEDEDEEEEDEDKDEDEDGDETDPEDGDETDPEDGDETEPEETEPEETDKEDLVGEWSYEKDVTDIMNETYAQIFGEDFAPESTLHAVVTMEFSDDGEYVLSMEFGDDAEDYFDEMVPYMVDYMYATLEASGLDKDTADAYIEETFGMTMEEYCAQSIDPDSFANEESGYYLVDEDAGYIYTASDEDDLEDSEDYMVYELDGDELTIEDLFSDGESITESEDNEGNPFAEMPWVMERQ